MRKNDLHKKNSHAGNKPPAVNDKQREQSVKKDGKKLPIGNPPRTAATYAIRMRMLQPLKEGTQEISYVWIADRIEKDSGKRYHVTTIHRTIHGERNSRDMQKAIARALGMPLDKAFPLLKTVED